MGITVSGDDPTGIPGTVTPEPPPPTVTVSIPGTPLPAVTQTVTEKASATPSVSVKTVTATPSQSAEPSKTPSPKVAKTKVVYRTKTAVPSTASNPIPVASSPVSDSTVRPLEEWMSATPIPSVASPAQPQPGIVIQMPATQPVSSDAAGTMIGIVVILSLLMAMAAMGVGLWAFMRKVKRADR